jgi:hypothetical protein
MRLSRNSLLALIGLSFILHNLEEYLAYPGLLAAPGRLARFLPTISLYHNPQRLALALLFVTVVPVAIIVGAMVSQRRSLLIASLLLESILLVNAFAHTLTAFLKPGYVPGLITALAINLPFGIYVLRRALREPWIGMRGMWRMIGVALAFHLVWHLAFLWRPYWAGTA